MRTYVKICGITRVEDALAAAYAGADAIGLVFYRPSPRFVSLEIAARVASALPPFVTLVGLFVDADPGEVATTLSRVPLDVLQFHGRESAQQCAAFGRRYIRAVRLRLDGAGRWCDGVTGQGLSELAAEHSGASALLLDSFAPSLPGGTGLALPWDRLPRDLDLPVILAGGLNPGNVARGIAAARPWGVDVSSGVESQPGIKEAVKIRQFIDEATGER